MMAPRLIELRRVLKSMGSIYLHCDETASHYLKILMDAIFGPVNFRNKIVWKRFNLHADAKRFGVTPQLWAGVRGWLTHDKREQPQWLMNIVGPETMKILAACRSFSWQKSRGRFREDPSDCRARELRSRRRKLKLRFRTPKAPRNMECGSAQLPLSHAEAQLPQPWTGIISALSVCSAVPSSCERLRHRQ